ncbi:MAG TPA: hypothetical protein DCR48_03790 [Flavobacteriales bacterium]|nr:hypothetical protein [Flavobacteriales bacterium]
MKRLLLIICLGLTMSTLTAQDSASVAENPWKKGALVGLNFSQTYLDNWQGGGQSAISGTALVNLFANYKKDKWTWDNTFDGAYGLTRIGENSVFQKTDDRIEINSKLGHTTPMMNAFWTAMFTFRTQWDAGYDYGSAPNPLISDPFAPAYILLGLGIDYKPSEGFSIYISPATSKTTIVDNQRLADAGAFGVEGATYDAFGVKTDGEQIRYEAGGYVKIQYTKEVLKNVKLSTRADFFSNYLNNPQNIDINWETLIAMKINDFLSASITTNLIYDDDIKIDVDRNEDGLINGRGPRTQFKEVFSLGVQYQF